MARKLRAVGRRWLRCGHCNLILWRLRGGLVGLCDDVFYRLLDCRAPFGKRRRRWLKGRLWRRRPGADRRAINAKIIWWGLVRLVLLRKVFLRRR